MAGWKRGIGQGFWEGLESLSPLDPPLSQRPSNLAQELILQSWISSFSYLPPWRWVVFPVYLDFVAAAMLAHLDLTPLSSSDTGALRVY